MKTHTDFLQDPPSTQLEQDPRLVRLYLWQSMGRLCAGALLIIAPVFLLAGVSLHEKGLLSGHGFHSLNWAAILPSLMTLFWLPITISELAKKNLREFREAGIALTRELISSRVRRELVSPFDPFTTFDLCAEALSGLGAGQKLGYETPAAFRQNPFKGLIVIGRRRPLWFCGSIEVRINLDNERNSHIRIRRRLSYEFFLIQKGEALHSVEAVTAYLREKLDHQAKMLETAKRERELEKVALNAKLSALQAQVEPHFLFNTLANLKHLIRTDPDNAQEMVDHLVGYLQNALPDMRSASSTLGREIELARDYLSIMQIRMGERLKFRIEISERLLEASFPPAMLISLVENAIKHGLENATRPGAISISAATSDDQLAVIVSDNGIGLTEHAGQGLGLSNIHDRLKLLYEGKASLSVSPGKDNGVNATIRVPLLPGA